MVKFFLSVGAEVDQRSFTGQTPLHLAVLGAHAALVELLLDKGANFQVFHPHWSTADYSPKNRHLV